jgi:N-acetylglucosamine-6-phosphate deacetylase
MSNVLALRGRVVTDEKVLEDAAVLVDGAKIRMVTEDRALPEDVLEYSGKFLVPGFVDLQQNGSFGIDVTYEPERASQLSRSIVKTGTTSYLPTVSSVPEEHYNRVLPVLATSVRLAKDGEAEVLGVHLEGPFISEEKKGAHLPEYISQANVGFLEDLLDLASVKLLTLAPELPGAKDLVRFADARGVVVAAGHSNASFEVAYESLEEGIRATTHLFNAMSPMHHRDPGLPGAALSHPEAVSGVIPDGIHVHPEIISLAFDRLGPDRMYVTPDAVAGAGLDAQEFLVAGKRARLVDRASRLETGELAGGLITMDEALRNVRDFTACGLPEAVRMVSTTPARLIGEGARKGRLAAGYDADVVVLSSDLEVEAVWIRGEKVYERESGDA